MVRRSKVHVAMLLCFLIVVKFIQILWNKIERSHVHLSKTRPLLHFKGSTVFTFLFVCHVHIFTKWKKRKNIGLYSSHRKVFQFAFSWIKSASNNHTRKNIWNQCAEHLAKKIVNQHQIECYQCHMVEETKHSQTKAISNQNNYFIKHIKESIQMMYEHRNCLSNRLSFPCRLQSFHTCEQMYVWWNCTPQHFISNINRSSMQFIWYFEIRNCSILFPHFAVPAANSIRESMD